jgi:ribosomal protein S18 acetylase RimI-like enzyme
MTGDVRLRPARADDADFFYEVRAAGFRNHVEQVFGPWVDTFQRPLADAEFAELPVEIIERDGAPIGYLAVVRHPDHWYLDEIALVPAARNRGLGTQLVRDVMAAASAAGLPVRLSVLHVNPAQALYAQLGFRVERIEPPRVKMVWP